MKTSPRSIRFLRVGFFFLMLSACSWLVACSAPNLSNPGTGYTNNDNNSKNGGNNNNGGNVGQPTTSPDAGPIQSGKQSGWGSNIGTGGAQDIGQFRKIIESGEIPHPNTLDANGFFSEHHTQLPAPTCGKTFCLHGMLARNKSFIGNETYHVLQLGMNSSTDVSKLPRLPLNLVVVIDTSGSMKSQNKLEYVKTGLKLMLDKLRPEDTLAIVHYSTKAETLRPAQAVTADNKSAVIDLIDKLRATGGTNIYDGLKLGYEECLKQSSDKKQNRVIFLSDGKATQGIIQTDKILEMSNQYVKKGLGLTTIGVGLSFNVTLMRSLAESGSGNYYFLESQEAIREVFQDEMDYFVVPIAYDIKISVALGNSYTLTEVLGTNLWQNTNEGGSIYIPSVFLTGRTAHDDPKAGQGGRRGGGSAIMLRLSDSLSQQLQSRQVAAITLTYRPAGETKEVTQQIKVDFSPTSQDQLSEPYYSHTAIEKNYVMLNVYLGLRTACQLAVLQQDPKAALVVLQKLKTDVVEWNKTFDDEDIKADLTLIGSLIQNLQKYTQTTSP
ncbi:MAG TPA: hypothetical protein DCE42_15685 [Myxococcales bacterium]|nr:hypothetical protein [Deltaproteobacteria bacterium]MBU47375.1 hypothetical protein [Deltaproteobacteria bacterium]HAA56205.1 hypothetical protein [Myxococcales bacterium]